MGRGGRGGRGRFRDILLISPTGIYIVIYNASVLVSQCLPTVHSPYNRKRTRCETVPHPFMALKRYILLDFRHRPFFFSFL